MRKILLFFIISTQISLAQTKSIEDFTKGFEKRNGYINFYWDNSKGKIFAEIKDLNAEFLYYPSLSQGVGSNDIGLDRGRLSEEHVLKFQKIANKILLIEPNYGFRAITNDANERKAVDESFAKSIHFSFDLLAESNNLYLIDLTPFLLQDAVNASQAISEAKQGSFRIDLSKCAVDLISTKNFPENTEFETILTLNGENAGKYLKQVAPTSTFITMQQHHSFIKLPDNQFQMRKFDPRIGYNGIEFYDYSSAIHEPIIKKYISRHRLQKKDPNAILSEAVEPIVYYMDRGTPEPIRTALIEGASWWNQAFEAAGYKDAFQVKLLPEDADPMDIRYNLIQWVHRSTRGWSYGSSITDPRTGEILKGKVSLGSLRVRQDYLIAQGLLGNFETDSSNVKEMTEMSLARLRQLAAHEVGHTLGLPHNYIASTAGRASVMDYPHPLVDLKNGKINLKSAYTEGIGDYDKLSIVWGYQDFPKNVNEETALEKIVQQSINRGLRFLTDQDARPEGSLSPQTHIWDNGSNASQELNRLIEIRKIALGNFTENKIPSNTPLAVIEEVFVPMFMFHRYQTEATAKMLGGADYNYVVKNDKQLIYKPVDGQLQREAFATLMKTLDASFLETPKNVLKLIPPRPFRYEPNQREVFKRHTGIGFDPLAPAEASAGLTIRLILNPERCARLANQNAYQNNLPSLSEVFVEMNKSLWQKQEMFRNPSYRAQIDRMVANLYLEHLMQLANNKTASNEVRANAYGAISGIKVWVNENAFDGNGFKRLSLLKITQFEQNPDSNMAAPAPFQPDGQPIESGYEWLDGCEQN